MEWEREGYPLCGKGSNEPATGQISPKMQVEGSRAMNPPSAPAAAPDAQTPESGKLSLQDHLREAFGKIGSTRGAWYLKEAWERLDSLERANAGLRELFQESQRRRVEHEDTIGDLRRQLAEAQDFVTAADEQVHFHGMAKERAEIRAEIAEAALAAERAAHLAEIKNHGDTRIREQDANQKIQTERAAKETQFYGLTHLVQYRRRDIVGSWINMAAFDSERIANRYATECSKGKIPWEYRVIPAAAPESEGRKP